MDETIVAGGLCLLPGQGLVPADLLCVDGRIAQVARHAHRAGARIVDASDALVLPGLVDIHGDAFERQILPRPKTMFPLDIATLETDRQLIANGITTAYHGITISWEPGLRSLAQALLIIESLDRLEAQLHADNRIHIRWETFALDEMPAVRGLFGRSKKPLLAFNDHTGPTLDNTRKDAKVSGSAERALVDVETYRRLLAAVAGRRSAVEQAVVSMAGAAREAGVPMLSHDDETPAMRRFYRDRGVRVAEFPMNEATLIEAAEAADDIVLGSPNVVRGGSHNGAIGAEEAIRSGRCSILASDYYYPAPLQAALSLADRGILPLEAAWEMISGAPAKACGLSDRGRISEGQRADLVIVPRGAARPVTVVAAGRVVYDCR